MTCIVNINNVHRKFINNLDAITSKAAKYA